MGQSTLIKKICIKNKHGQVWSLDLIIASIIFLGGIISLYIYAINYSPQSKQEIEELFYEGNLAAKQILSEEYPGIVTDKKINQTKLEEFSTTDYNSLKIMLGITHDFYFKFEGLELEGISTEYVGKTNSTQINNIVKTTRLSIYKNKPIKFEIFIWN